MPISKKWLSKHGRHGNINVDVHNKHVDFKMFLAKYEKKSLR